MSNPYDYVFFTDVSDTVLIYKAIGIYKIANSLRRRDRRCLVVDNLHTWSWPNLKSLIDATITSDTKAIGFSNTFMMDTDVFPNADGSMTYNDLPPDYLFPQGRSFEDRFIDHVKQINPNIKIILGGTKTRAACANKHVNFVVLGYGESSIINIDSHLFDSTELTHCQKNIWGVSIIDNRRSEGYDFQNSVFEWQSLDVIQHTVLPIEISRGCIFKCAFCSYPMNGKKTLDFVRHSNLLKDEMQRNHDLFKVRHYYLLDDTFNDNDHKLNLVLDAVQKLDFRPEFWAYLRLDLMVTKHHSQLLYDLGMRHFYFGIETLNPVTGRAIGKGQDRNKQIDMICWLKNKYPDVSLHGSFIVGLPHESLDQVQDTFHLCLSKEIPLDTVKFTGLHIRNKNFAAWSSPIEQDPFKFGYQISQESSNKLELIWHNQYTNSTEADVLARHFNTQLTQTAGFKIPGRDILALKNLGYSDQWLHNRDYRDIDWYDVNCRKKTFTDTYQAKLLNLMIDPKALN